MELLEENNDMFENLLADFDKVLTKLSYRNLWYKVSKFFWQDVDLLAYKNKRKDYIFFIDKSWVENHISIYKAIDNRDHSEWIIMELIIWETGEKDIMFFSEGKIYNIMENKWWKILDSRVIDNQESITSILNIFNREIDFLSNKTSRYKTKLKQKGVLLDVISEKKIENFKIAFRQNILQLV